WWFTEPGGLVIERERYARMIGIEPGAHPSLDEHVEPIVVCNRDECRPAGSLRARFELAAGEPAVVVMHAGKAGELEALRAVERANITVDLHASPELFPVAAWLPDA